MSCPLARGVVLTVVLVTALPAVRLWAQTLLDSAQARVAQYDGILGVAGLDSAVEVRRDRWGVPHIFARTQHDLFFAQGYVAAQDRLWQMEMWRRKGEGRLAEALGPAYVERDRVARLLRYRGDHRDEWRSYAPDAEAIARAFVEGVNAYIRDIGDRLPIEFVLLSFRPGLWTPDAMLQRLGAFEMTGNAFGELALAEQVVTLGVGTADSLNRADPYRALDPTAGLDLRALSPAVLGALGGATGPIAYPPIQGSNNWVVSGRHTTSGKPLLANDPHRAVGLPSLRYLVHLVGPGWNVIGAGEPGLPGVSGGHNEDVGFGFTIVGMDQQDLYVEQVAACPQRSGRCYFHRGSWRPLRVIMDTIPVRGAPPRIVQLTFTVHGPIVAEDSARGRALALRFVGSEPGTAGYLAQLSLNRVRDWPSFRAAAARWKLPTENLVYADTAGNIGWIAAGLMPERSWSGRLPVPGDGRYEWEGFRRFADLPQTYNPRAGLIVTANNNILPPGYAKPLNYDWAPSYRADRIRALLDQGGLFRREDFERLQHDEFSIPASRLVPLLLEAATRRGHSGEGLDTLRAWDFTMRRDQAGPLIYVTWVQALGALVIGRRQAPIAYKYSARDQQVLDRLLHEPERPTGSISLVSRDSILLAALDTALIEVKRLVGPDPRAWRWGAVHIARFRHPLATAFDLADIPRGGDGHTVNATPGRDLRQTAGASFRMVLDLADWDNSTATTAPGQSGQPGSQFYGDRLQDWGEGNYFPLVYSRPAVERETRYVLRLIPVESSSTGSPSR